MSIFQVFVFVVVIVASVGISAGFCDWAKKRAEAGHDMKHVTQLNLALFFGFAGLFLTGLVIRLAFPYLFPVSWTMLVCGIVCTLVLGFNHVELIKTYRLARQKAVFDRQL